MSQGIERTDRISDLLWLVSIFVGVELKFQKAFSCIQIGIFIPPSKLHWSRFCDFQLVNCCKHTESMEINSTWLLNEIFIQKPLKRVRVRFSRTLKMRYVLRIKRHIWRWMREEREGESKKKARGDQRRERQDREQGTKWSCVCWQCFSFVSVLMVLAYVQLFFVVFALFFAVLVVVDNVLFVS